MKLTSILIALAFISHSYAQTNVISLKSHSGDLALVNSENDNYGMPMMEITIDTVKLYKENCLIEIKTIDGMEGVSDTICDHPYLKGNGSNYNQIKQRYPSGVVFQGFKRSPRINRIDQSTRFNGFSLIGRILILSLLVFVFTPIAKK